MIDTAGTSAQAGTWKNGHVILDGQADWPEGCRVIVIREPVPGLVGMTDEEQGEDPESIARWLAAFDAIPPLEMTPDEEAEWRTAREDRRAPDRRVRGEV